MRRRAVVSEANLPFYTISLTSSTMSEKPVYISARPYVTTPAYLRELLHQGPYRRVDKPIFDVPELSDNFRKFLLSRIVIIDYVE